MNGENLICWVDAKELLPFKKEDAKPRQNVSKYEIKNGGPRQSDCNSYISRDWQNFGGE